MQPPIFEVSSCPRCINGGILRNIALQVAFQIFLRAVGVGDALAPGLAPFSCRECFHT